MTQLPQLPLNGAKVHKEGVCKKRKCGKRVSKRDKIISFMKRNRVFRVGDLIIIFDISEAYAKWLMWDFKRLGLVELKSSNKKFTERIYLFRGERK